jgi:hypothetical protein
MVQVNEKIVMCGFGRELPTMMSIPMKSRAMVSAHKVTLDPLPSISCYTFSFHEIEAKNCRQLFDMQHFFILASNFLDLGPT